MATNASARPRNAAVRANGSTTSATPVLISRRNRKNGRNRSANGSSRTARRTPKTIRNGSVNRNSTRSPCGIARTGQAGDRSLTCARYTLLTSRSVNEFRRLELVGRTARRARGQVGHRLVADPLLQALDHLRAAAGGLHRLREAEDDAEADEEYEDEHRARRQSLKRPPGYLRDVGVHASIPSGAGVGSRTS